MLGNRESYRAGTWFQNPILLAPQPMPLAGHERTHYLPALCRDTEGMKMKPDFLAIPVFTRMGSRVEKILHFDPDTFNLRFIREDGEERCYHLSDFVHHQGTAGIAAHIRAAGFNLK